MSDNGAAGLVRDLIALIPTKEAYQDALAPGMKETGIIIENLVKTVHLALIPFQYAASLQDRYASFLRGAAEKVPEADRIPPPTQILGPVLEGIKYEDDEGMIWEMFSSLLSNSMDRNKLRVVHPAFPMIVRQLAPDEAKLLRVLHHDPENAKIVAVYAPDDANIVRFRTWKVTGTVAKEDMRFLHHIDNFDVYFEHLDSMRLFVQVASKDGVEFRLSSFGETFMQAVTRPDVNCSSAA